MIRKDPELKTAAQLAFERGERLAHAHTHPFGLPNFWKLTPRLREWVLRGYRNALN